jgi:hypothetical protein
VLVRGSAIIVFSHAPQQTQKQTVDAWKCQCGESYVPGEIARKAFKAAMKGPDESPSFMFDETVLPIIFAEVESKQPSTKEHWDREALSKSLKEARDTYDGIVWPSAYEQKPLILTAAYVAIVLTRFFESPELLESVSLKILRLWRSKCDTFSQEELLSLQTAAIKADPSDLYELMFDKVSASDPRSRQSPRRSTTQETESRESG